jgi:transcriptional regulator with XRE-family HTH domain
MIPSRRLTTTLESIAANVRKARQRRNLTQEQLAEKADLDLRYVQRVERGSTNLSVSVLVKLSETLGVNPTSLFSAAKMEPSRPGRPSTKRAAVAAK